MKRLSDEMCRRLAEDDSNLAVLVGELLARLHDYRWATDVPPSEHGALLARLEAER